MSLALAPHFCYRSLDDRMGLYLLQQALVRMDPEQQQVQLRLEVQALPEPEERLLEVERPSPLEAERAPASRSSDDTQSLVQEQAPSR